MCVVNSFVDSSGYEVCVKPNWKDGNKLLKEGGVRLLSAGIDEVPNVYKDIHEVMAVQADLVEPLVRFFPCLVKMAPSGERPED